MYVQVHYRCLAVAVNLLATYSHCSTEWLQQKFVWKSPNSFYRSVAWFVSLFTYLKQLRTLLSN